MCVRSRSVLIHVVLAGIVLGTIGVPLRASADWPPCGRTISGAPDGQVHSTIATDGADGAIIAWQDFRSPRINIFAQHVLLSGELDTAWPVDGRALLTDPLAMESADGGQTSPVIVTDGAGGAIVAWQDNRSSVTETDIFAQHILASGVVDPDWKENGAGLCVIEGLQNTLAIASDGAGGAIVTWMDGRPKMLVPTSEALAPERGASVNDIYAQHVLASGIADPLWPINGLAVSTAPGLQEFPAIVEDGVGGAIISWDDSRSTTSSVDVFAQHILSSGRVDRGWPLNGRALCTADRGQGRTTITSDGAHGAIVAWTDGRIVDTFHIFAQHVFGSGVVDPAWPVNGRVISDAGIIESRPLAVPDGAGGAIVAWQAFTVHINMYAQHVQATGVVDPAWPAGGRALSLTDRNQTHAAIASDGAGGAVVAWDDSFDVVAQHVLASGVLDPAYPENGLLLCDLPSQQGDPALVATGGGGAIVAWTDTRSGIDTDIFALQALAAAATVNVPPSAPPPGITFAHPHPNPARGQLTLRFALSREARVRLTIYDTTGRRVRELVSGARPAGEHAIEWDLRGEHGHAVGAGLYFARLEAGGRSLTQKFTALR